MALMGYTAVLPYMQSGKLKVVMTAGRQRSPVLPDVPTAAESGYPQLQAETWYGLFAPAGTPKSVVDRIAAEGAKVLSDPSLVERLAGQGAEPAPSTPAELSALLRDDLKLWAGIVRASGATID